MNRIVKASEAEFWQVFGGFCPPGGFFHVRGSVQAGIDRRLSEAIDELLVPKLGSVQGPGTWAHEFGAYRDGIHSLLFAESSFDPDLVPSLQGLLAGEHEVYCILCQVFSPPAGAQQQRIGSIAIRSNRVLVSYPLVKHFNGRV